jgi:hypothetical protein
MMSRATASASGPGGIAPRPRGATLPGARIGIRTAQSHDRATLTTERASEPPISAGSESRVPNPAPPRSPKTRYSVTPRKIVGPATSPAQMMVAVTRGLWSGIRSSLVGPFHHKVSSASELALGRTTDAGSLERRAGELEPMVSSRDVIRSLPRRILCAACPDPNRGTQ